MENNRLEAESLTFGINSFFDLIFIGGVLNYVTRTPDIKNIYVHTLKGSLSYGFIVCKLNRSYICNL